MKYFDMQKYKVLITDEAVAKIDAFIDIVPVEVSGLGTATEKNGIYLIDDIFLFRQICTGATTSLNQGHILELMTNLIDSGKENTVNCLRLWWHSHVNMGVFWSGKDSYTIDKMEPNPAWISIVGNKHGLKKTRIDYHNPRICFDNVNLEVIKTKKDLSKIKEQCKKEVDEKVFLYNRPIIINANKENKELDDIKKLMENMED